MADEEVTAGAAVAEPPSQPDPSTPAAGDTPPADTSIDPLATEQADDDAPDGDDESTPTFDLSDDTLDAIVTLGKDKIVSHPEVQETIQREAQKIAQQATRDERTDFSLDAEWNRITGELQQVEQVWEPIVSQAATVLERFNQGDEQVTPQHVAAANRQLLQGAQKITELSRQKAEHEQFRTVDGVAQNLLDEHHDTVIGKLADGAEATVETVYGAALERYNRLKSAGANLERSGQPLTERELKARAQALPQLVQDVLTIGIALGNTQGEQRASTKLAREQKAREQLIKDNQLQELAAQGKLGTGTAPAANGRTPAGKPALNKDTLLTGTWQDAKKVFEAAGHRI